MIKNIAETKELITRYNEITEQEVKVSFTDSSSGHYNKKYSWYNVRSDLTGFGNITTCSLCVGTVCETKGHDCSKCIHSIGEVELEDADAENCETTFTYLAIKRSRSPETLVAAYRERAKYLNKLLKKHIKK